MCYCQFSMNLGGAADLRKSSKEYLNAETCKLYTFLYTISNLLAYYASFHQ